MILFIMASVVHLEESKKVEKDILWIENTSHSNIIIDNNERHNVIHKTTCPTAFFFNYANYSYTSNSCLFYINVHTFLLWQKSLIQK